MLKNIFIACCVGVWVIATAGSARAYDTYNAVLLTRFEAAPSPFDPSLEATTFTVDTFEYAEWFWLSPTTMVEPTVIVNVAGRPLIADPVSASLSVPGFFGVPPIYYWYNQTGEWSHQTVWDGADLTGQAVSPGPYLATVNVYAGGSNTFGATIVEVWQDRLLRLTIDPSEIPPDGTVAVRVEVVDGQGDPVPDYGVQLEAHAPTFSVAPCDECGGHSHDGGRPVGTFLSQSGAELGSLITGSTGPAGEPWVLQYRASEFGGTERVVATSLENLDLESTRQLTVTVPNLQPLAASPHYVKVGGTATHHGPPGYAVDHNHYGTANLVNAIQAIAGEHWSLYTQRLMINDMSLPNGGGFDIRGRWTFDIEDTNPGLPGCQSRAGHCTHRLGTNADVDDLTYDGFLVDVFWLENMVVNMGGSFLDETNHYHITFN